ncbi:hypothetical protein [Vibrio ezurae]|uniref:Uncharacterized protein n=1 Tax=Vibrio ezurae NBRC 102218 TaxID=1219080 RepID=U3B1A9_9VIBR|nr:hypothetical protein [Vibrio ezurae]GAD79242.1 hypothetical protein VEZ01S_09_00100 [Vibrio ezurae NBRC 102218]
MFNASSKKATSSPLSNFVKRTSSSEKKKVYKRVIVAASEAQNSTIEKAKAIDS